MISMIMYSKRKLRIHVRLFIGGELFWHGSHSWWGIEWNPQSKNLTDFWKRRGRGLTNWNLKHFWHICTFISRLDNSYVMWWLCFFCVSLTLSLSLILVSLLSEMQEDKELVHQHQYRRSTGGLQEDKELVHHRDQRREREQDRSGVVRYLILIQCN